MRCAEWPEVVRTTMAAALLLLAASTAAIAILEDADVKSANNCLCQTAVSASLQMVAIVRTHLTGYAPLAVSPDSITLSAPSRMAFATSEYSARVPRGGFICGLHFTNAYHNKFVLKNQPNKKFYGKSIIYTLSSERTRRGPTKIGFSAHPQTSSCRRETGFDNREVQEDAQNRRVLLLDRL
ncbi:hypothetical protein AGLY_017235 [Aphis glycines]|uniref:Uncharacterized protein n=1 Tax=Aphis glycines TaxID=307491 RepID=A0A6G0SVG4_APHGL|nr:hypothetical protein AGLY_017235 [Aphis glycines]